MNQNQLMRYRRKIGSKNHRKRLPTTESNQKTWGTGSNRSKWFGKSASNTGRKKMIKNQERVLKAWIWEDSLKNTWNLIITSQILPKQVKPGFDPRTLLMIMQWALRKRNNQLQSSKFLSKKIIPNHQNLRPPKAL